VQAANESIKDQMITRYGDGDGKHSGVLMAEHFADLLATECSSLSESDRHLLTLYAVKGSRRVHGGEPGSARVDLSNDLIQYYHFERALEDVIQELRKEVIMKQQNLTDEAQSDQLAKYR
jgi:hypothetical protein